MDMLRHVNNVTYLDYLQEARIDLLLNHGDGDAFLSLADGAQIVSHQVQYVAPLTFRLRPILVDTWVVELGPDSAGPDSLGEFTLAHEVYDVRDGQRTVYLRARSVLARFRYDEDRRRPLSDREREVLTAYLDDDVLGDRVPIGPPREVADGAYDLRVRFSDLDAFGIVDEVQHFEFFQEARVNYLTRVWKRAGAMGARTPMVIAQMDVDYLEPMRFRSEPFTVRSWVSHVGRSSFVVESDLRDPTSGETFSRARVVLVSFDPATQKAAPAPEELRDLWLAELGR